MNNPVLLYDGVCNLCNRAVQFILKHEKDTLIRFVSLQSEKGKKILNENQDLLPETETIVFIENGKTYIKSEALFFISCHLKSPWREVLSLRMLPSSLRDAAYDLIARTRYRILGKKSACPLPEKKWEDRFL